MPRLLAAALLASAMIASPAPADEKADREAKAKELEAKIAEAEKKLAELRKEYDALTPCVPAKTRLWERGSPEVGTYAALADNTHKVVEVIDGQTAAVQFGYKGTGPTFVVQGVPTKGWADDAYVRSSGDWKVVGTVKYGGKTVFGLRPADGAEMKLVTK